MVTAKKGITKANKYTKKRGRLIHNNSNSNNNNSSNNTKILHNFYKGIFKTNKDLALILTSERNSSNQFLEYIYKQLNAKQLIINALTIEKSRTNEENKSIIVNKITSIVNNHLRSTKYIDSELINFILTNTNCKIVTYKNIIKGKTYIFDFIIYNNEISIKNLDLIVEKMLLVLQLIIAISNNESRNGQHVTFFLTPFQKKLNINNSNSISNILGAKNVNSGFTYPYLKNGVTFIYRKEEFFKVFIHESIHYYGIDKALHNDFGNDAKYNINYNKFINSFNIRPQDIANIGINEGLTEYWTFIIYLIAQSYKKSIALANFIYEFENSYKLELLHIIFQVVKILNYNKLTYSEFLTKSSAKYKETSHIFSYYIVKTLLVYNHADLLKSTIFDINFSSSINIALKPDVNSINNFFIKLLSYATDCNFINIINKVSAYISNITNTKINTRSIYKQKIILSNLMMMYNDNNII